MDARHSGDGHRRVTITDLARELQLSKSAVSYALNGVPGVSEATRSRVRAHAHARGWQASSTARALSRGRTGAVGLVLARPPELIANEPFYSLVIAGMEQVLMADGTALMLRMVGEGGHDLQVYRDWAAERRVDGVVVFDARTDDPRVDLLPGLGLPAVFYGQFDQARVRASVDPDEEADARTVVEHLTGAGHRRLVHVSGPVGLRHEPLRSAVLRRLSEQAGAQLEVVVAEYSFDSGREVGRRLLGAVREPFAVVCSDDLLALGVLSAARDLGCPVPDRLALVSWDDSMACQMASPPVTALDRHTIELGRSVAEQLLRVVAGEPPRPLRQRPAELVVRGTS